MANRIAKCKKQHIIAEELIKSCVGTMVKKIIGSEAKKKIQQVSLFNDNIHRRNDDMAANVMLLPASLFRNQLKRAPD